MTETINTTKSADPNIYLIFLYIHIVKFICDINHSNTLPILNTSYIIIQYYTLTEMEALKNKKIKRILKNYGVLYSV